MNSPYPMNQRGAPPPPPNVPQWIPVRNPTPPSRGRGRGVLIAFMLFLLAAGGVVYAQSHPASNTTAVVATATALPATATVQPTDTPAATTTPQATNTPEPTATPQATDTPQPVATQTLPANYQRYVGENAWTIAYPMNMKYSKGTVNVQGVTIPDVVFTIANNTTLTIYDSPLAVTNDTANVLFASLLSQSGATNIAIIDQPAPATIGAVTWQRAKFSATLGSTASYDVALYAAHGARSIAINYHAPVGTFDATEQQTFLQMVQSFVFTQ